MTHVRNIRQVEAQRIAMFPVHYGKFKLIIDMRVSVLTELNVKSALEMYV